MSERCRQAVILAAGRGTRLAPITDDRPKCLVEVAGRSLLERTLDSLARSGIEEALLVIGHRAEMVRQHLSERPPPLRVVLAENLNFARTNNAVSLWLVRDQIRPPLLLMDGDVWLNVELMRAMMEPDRIALAHRRPDMAGTMASVRTGKVTALGATGDLKTVNAASFGAEWWGRWLLHALDRLIAEERVTEFYEAAIGDALAIGAPPLAVVMAHDRSWFELDTPSDLAAAERLLETCGT